MSKSRTFQAGSGISDARTGACRAQAMFGAVGELRRLVLPPTRTLALVEFLEPTDARTAFRKLAYKRFQHVPLYLEWAPADVFTVRYSRHG